MRFSSEANVFKVCMDVKLNSVNNGAPIIAWSCNGNPNQVFEYNRKQQIVSVSSGKCVSVDERMRIIQETCRDENIAQKWDFTDSFQIQSLKSPEKCIENAGGLLIPGRALLLSECKNASYFYWRRESVHPRNIPFEYLHHEGNENSYRAAVDVMKDTFDIVKDSMGNRFQSSNEVYHFLTRTLTSYKHGERVSDSDRATLFKVYMMYVEELLKRENSARYLPKNQAWKRFYGRYLKHLIREEDMNNGLKDIAKESLIVADSFDDYWNIKSERTPEALEASVIRNNVRLLTFENALILINDAFFANQLSGSV